MSADVSTFAAGFVFAGSLLQPPFRYVFKNWLCVQAAADRARALLAHKREKEAEATAGAAKAAAAEDARTASSNKYTPILSRFCSEFEFDFFYF